MPHFRMSKFDIEPFLASYFFWISSCCPNWPSHVGEIRRFSRCQRPFRTIYESSIIQLGITLYTKYRPEWIRL